MIYATPLATDITCASATATTSNLVSIPAGRWFTCDIALSVTAALAGTASASVTFTPNGTGTGPSTSKVVARCSTTGLLASATANNSTISAVFYGGDSGAQLDYTAASSGTSTCVIDGFLI